MRAPPELPPGYALERRGGAVRAAPTELAAALDAAGFGVDGDRGELPDSDLSGRSALGQLEVGGRRLLVRRYRHGGLLRWFTGARFADRWRPFRELCLAHRLRALGLPTPEVVAARARRAGWLPGHRLDLISVRLEGARDLATEMELLRSGGATVRHRQQVTAALGRLLGELHRAGLAHADLQLRNLLHVPRATSAVPELWIIDLDRSQLAASLAPAARAANLSRLVRNALRRDGRGRPVLARTDLARLLRAYSAPESWRPWWRAVVSHLAKTGFRHRLGWWLEARVGADPARRDGAARVR
jgi:tRNA A-37 threonylcarbamoyl transferase component Bud32